MTQDQQLDVPVKILLVEDDETDIKFITRAFERIWDAPTIAVVRNGEQALQYLRKQQDYGSAATPDLVLLDLNMPGKNGYEVLTEAKRDPELKHIPIVVLTTSSDEESIEESYKLHANSFITKPATFDELQSVVQQVVDYWRGVARLPQSN